MAEGTGLEANGGALRLKVEQNERNIHMLQEASRVWDRNDEQINGQYGIHKAIGDLDKKIDTERQENEDRHTAVMRLLSAVGIGVVLAAITFALNALGGT